MENRKEIKIGDFLFERKGKYKPDNSAIAQLKRLNKIDFSGQFHIVEKHSKTDMIIIFPGDLVISGINVAKGAMGIYQGNENIIATIHYSSYTFDTDKIDVEYFKRFLKSSEFVKLLQQQVKGGIKTEIKPKHLLPLKIKLPDIKEQKRKVRYFKSIEAEDAELKQELTNQRIILTKLRQQIIQEAIQGKLTADWRRNSPPVEGWQAKPDGVVPPSEGWQAKPDGVVPPSEGWQAKPDGVVPPSEGGQTAATPSDGVVPRNTKNYHSLPYNPALKQRARELRKAGNLSEALFWNQIKRGKFNGLDFDRQKIIGNYIVDFYCPNLQIVIEIDGASHDDKEKYDEQRDNFLQGLGLTVIHIADDDIKGNLGGVMEWLKAHEAFLPTCWDSSADGPPRQAEVAPLILATFPLL